MPRLTNRVFTDLALWMTGFGLFMGVVFPPFVVILGLPVERVLTPVFFAATVLAGLVVGGVNFALARLVVGRRLRMLANRMETVESRLATAVFTHDWSGCDPATCALPVDSDDEVGASAGAFNRLITTVARSHGVESAMRDFSAVLSREFELDPLGVGALDGLLRATGADAGAILLAREDGIQALASHGLRSVDELATNDHVRRAMRLQRQERLTVGDPALVIDSLLVAQPAREVLITPVTFKGIPLGAVVLAASVGFAPDASDLLELLRADLGLALNNALAHDRLERLAAVDPLTDVYNRRFGTARLQEEFSRATRAESPLAALMIDIDHFKLVNDTYGHLVGDRVLRAVAHACRRVLREGDVLVRFGGEEFLALLPGAGEQDVLAIAERARRAVSETLVHEGEQSIRVTVSVGATTNRSRGADSPDGLVAVADGALYAAKEAGRDRLVLR